MLFKCLFLVFSLIFNRFYLFCKCFTERRICKLCLFYYLLWSDGNISSPVRYSYLSSFPDDNPDIFAASRLISYCIFSSLILLSVAVINFYILPKRFISGKININNQKRTWFCSILFIKIHKVLKVNIWWIIKCSLLKFSFVWNFHNKIECWV